MFSVFVHNIIKIVTRALDVFTLNPYRMSFQNHLTFLACFHTSYKSETAQVSLNEKGILKLKEFIGTY